MGDDAGERPRVVGVLDVETLGDELGVALVFGEDDGLPQPVAVADLVALELPGRVAGAESLSRVVYVC